jgi:hypothetical protein
MVENKNPSITGRPLMRLLLGMDGFFYLSFPGKQVYWMVAENGRFESVKPFLYSIHAETLCREEHHTHQSESWPSDHNAGITAVIMSAGWRQAYPHPWNIYHSLNG